MTLRALDHVTIRTADLAGMTAFYTETLGLEPGPRPPVRVAGAWLYCGGRPVVHLVEVAEAPRGARLGEAFGGAREGPRIEHFAFRAQGLAEFLGHLRARDIAHRFAVVPGLELRQVHISDPDGNHVEIAFGPEEALPPEPFAPAA
ncbi:MAG: VOC family protein [Kiloniellaceae bacterium]